MVPWLRRSLGIEDSTAGSKENVATGFVLTGKLETRGLRFAEDGKLVGIPAPLWLQRVSIVILVVFCFYVGLLVFLLPWTRYWNENHYLLTFSPIGRLMSSGITRGVVSGLGLLDVWIGISEIIHYHEHRA